MKNTDVTRLTLFKKLFFTLMVSVYIPLLLVGYLTYYKSSEQIEKMTSAFLADNLVYNKTRIEEYFVEVERQSVKVYSSPKLQSLLEKFRQGDMAEYEYLNSIGTLHYELGTPYFLSIYPIRVAPFLEYNNLRANSPVKDTDWFNQALELEGNGFWMHEHNIAFLGPASNFYYIRSIRSLQTANPFEDVGVMTFRVPARQIEEQMLLLDRYPNHRIAIYDQQNENLTPYASTEEEGSWLKDELSSQGQQFKLVKKNGQGYYVASFPIGSYGWKLVSTIPVSDVNGPVEQLKKFTWYIVLISLALIFLLLTAISNSFTRPIQTVVGHMKRLNLGFLERCTAYTTRKDEVGQLVFGYNKMIQNMDDLLQTTKTTEQKKRKLEIQMLMHQINPHFLYNTLSSITWKAELAGESSIAEMTTLLADLLRFSLDEGEEMTTVEREIEHVKCYLKIELLRSNSGFRVMYNIHPDVWNNAYMKLSLQPIVENSVRHGMKKLPPGTGKIIISMYAEENDIICVVEDNGPGCTDEELDALNNIYSDRAGETRSGIGLNNVSKRLRVHFDSSCRLSFERGDSSGLRVIIRQPLSFPAP